MTAAPKSLGATNMINWSNAILDSSKTGAGLFCNVIRIDGSIDTNLWSYNQGVMIGASVLRYALSGNNTYLNQAIRIANNALRTYGNFQTQPPSFNVMLFQNLLMLFPYASTLQSAITHAIQNYGDWAWNNPAARSFRTNLFYFDDAGQPVGGTVR